MRDGWKAVPLSDAIEHTIGGVWGGESDTDEVEVTVVRSTEFTKRGYLNFETGVSRSIKHSQLKSRELKEGDILLEKSGGGPDQPVGRVVYVTEEIPNKFVCSNFVQLVRPNSKIVEPLLLFHIMWRWHAINRTLEFQAQTTGIRNLRTPDYLEQEIELPPLPEQKRIVDLISSVDSYIETLQQQLESAKKSRNAVLYELLTGGGDDWVETTLGQEFEICKNGKNYKDGISTEGLPISRIQTIASGKIDLTKVGFGNFFLQDAEGFLLEEGDILFSHINSLPHVGKVAIVQHNHLPLIHGMNLLRMRFANSNDTNFMFYLMQNESMRDEIRSRAQVAVNQVSINISSIKTIKIVIPPLRTQKEIASLICAWDNLIEECENNLNSSRNLRVGLLSELLSGEHEIPASYDKFMGAA